MSLGITRLFEEAEALADRRRLLPAIQTWDQARQLTRFPERRAWATFNIGVAYWHLLGNGVAAREEFRVCISEFDRYGYGSLPALKQLHANALENAMLCALSLEEFERLAASLNALLPGLPIITGLVPQVRAWHDRGDPWSTELLILAGSYYIRNDPRRDPGRYGEARSTYHLLLSHRRALRLCRLDWRMAVYEFCALSMRMASDCMMVRGGDNDLNPREEFLPILTEALPEVDQYLAVNSGDDGLQKVRDDLDRMINGITPRIPQQSQPVGRNMSQATTRYQVCQKCGKVYSQVTRSSSNPIIDSMAPLHERRTMCINCGGDVLWQSSPDEPRAPALGMLLAPLFLLVVLLAAGWLIFGR